MIRTAALLNFLLFAIGGHAQTASIRLAVMDSLSHQPLEGATVSLFRLPDSTLSKRTRSGPQGTSWRNLPAGNYLLTATYLGYAPDSVKLQLMDSSVNLKLLLQRSVKNLMEVIVHHAIPPVIVKSDTIAFNVRAYPTRPYASVEDLLKKLPGIDIDKNGNVTLQGQKVDKVYIDGKEFFLNDVKTATQNLPADIVNQIEAFDSQTEQGRLTGVRDVIGNKTINIKLKKIAGGAMLARSTRVSVTTVIIRWAAPPRVLAPAAGSSAPGMPTTSITSSPAGKITMAPPRRA